MITYFILAIFAIFLLLVRIFQNQIVGRIGEKYTAKIVQKVTGGRVFHDVYVGGSRGVQQIDIIAVTRKGVLVIEKKTFIGLILGSKFEKQWTVIAGNGKQRYRLKNPHHQNFGHVLALLENFPQLGGKIFGLVIFGNNAKLGSRTPENTVRDDGFEHYYASLSECLSDSEIEQVSNQIQKLGETKIQNKKLHKKKLRDAQCGKKS